LYNGKERAKAALKVDIRGSLAKSKGKGKGKGRRQGSGKVAGHTPYWVTRDDDYMGRR
jgi:hypothetical protein